jgi:hypothetical protein
LTDTEIFLLDILDDLDFVAAMHIDYHALAVLHTHLDADRDENAS